jgi:hypothetical protein
MAHGTGVLVVFSASWQVYRLADGVGLGPAFKLPTPSAAATPLNHPMMAGRGMLGGESTSHFMRPRRTTAFFTPDHIICALSGNIRGTHDTRHTQRHTQRHTRHTLHTTRHDTRRATRHARYSCGKAVIWKASLCEGTAPQFVDKLASSEWFLHTQVVCRQSSDALLVTLAGNEILCWQLPAKVGVLLRVCDV